MKRLALIAVLAAGTLLAPLAEAAPTPVDISPTFKADPINAMCPIGKEPIVPSAGTIDYEGNMIGLCCPGCGKAFMEWDVDRRDAFVVMALNGTEPGHSGESAAAASTTASQTATAPAAADAAQIPGLSFPYTLDVCVISGSKLGSMGDPIVKVYDGRQVRFCCAGCIDGFESDKDGNFKKLDALIIKDQLRYYPVQTCVVMGDALEESGDDAAINVIYGNRLVRLCCRMCERKFAKNPQKYIEELDKAAADAQRPDYPLETCVVAGGALGSMGDPVEIVIAGRLMRFCCAGCIPKAKSDPAKYIERIDAAWQAEGRYVPEATSPAAKAP